MSSMRMSLTPLVVSPHQFFQQSSFSNTNNESSASCVNSTCLRTLSHCIAGFTNVTMRQMPMHLHATCRCLSPANAQGNNARMQTSCDAGRCADGCARMPDATAASRCISVAIPMPLRLQQLGAQQLVMTSAALHLHCMAPIRLLTPCMDTGAVTSAD